MGIVGGLSPASRAIAIAAVTASALLPTPSTPVASATTCGSAFVPPSVDADCYFLYMLGQNGISYQDPQKAILNGHEACQLLGQESKMAVLEDYRSVHPDVPISKAAVFVGLAEAAYCPGYISR